MFVALPLVLMLCAGCQMTQSSFARTAGNAGAGFAAAETTLHYVHAGRLTVAYAKASFVDYQSELDGMEQQLARDQGAPPTRDVQRLLALYTPAIAAVDHPCLNAACDWRAQRAALGRASAALLKASGP